MKATVRDRQLNKKALACLLAGTKQSVKHTRRAKDFVAKEPDAARAMVENLKTDIGWAISVVKQELAKLEKSKATIEKHAKDLLR